MMDFLAASALNEYWPHPAKAIESPNTPARDPAETERNRVLMHPLRIVRKDGNAFVARKT
jgi:hypothetical protein